MRIALCLLGLFLPALPCSATSVLVCERPDGRVAVVHWQGEDRTVPPDLVGLRCLEQDSSELPPRQRRNAWRLNPAGKVVVDASVQTPQERDEALRQAIRQKLKAGSPLTDAEIDFLLKQ